MRFIELTPADENDGDRVDVNPYSISFMIVSPEDGMTLIGMIGGSQYAVRESVEEVKDMCADAG